MACGSALLVALAAFGLHVAAASGQGSVAGVQDVTSASEDIRRELSSYSQHCLGTSPTTMSNRQTTTRGAFRHRHAPAASTTCSRGAPASLKSDDEENVSDDEDSEAASWVDLMYAAHDWLARRDERGHDLELWLHPKHHTENIAVHYLLIIAHGMLAYSPLIILIIWCTRPPAREVVERSSRG
jgi:hypothetical protein